MNLGDAERYLDWVAQAITPGSTENENVRRLLRWAANQQAHQNDDYGAPGHTLNHPGSDRWTGGDRKDEDVQHKSHYVATSKLCAINNYPHDAHTWTDQNSIIYQCGGIS